MLPAALFHLLRRNIHRELAVARHSPHCLLIFLQKNTSFHIRSFPQAARFTPLCSGNNMHFRALLSKPPPKQFLSCNMDQKPRCPLGVLPLSRIPGPRFRQLFALSVALSSPLPCFIKSAGLRKEPQKKYGPSYFLLFAAKYTSKTEISAGDTPDIRDACPTLRGRISLSFVRASRRSPLIF